MERRASPFDCSRDITMAAEGMEERVDDRTLFCTPAPLAASTVSRDSNRLIPYCIFSALAFRKSNLELNDLIL